MSRTSIKRDMFVWHFGVVENRDDPLEIGRVQVRFRGVHSEDKGAVPTETLPWAQVISPYNPTSGVGGPATGIVEGAWVIGFFIDQESYQRPMVLGAISGLPTLPPEITKGFNDPNGNYPRNGIDGLNGLEESDLSRLSRGAEAEKHESLLQRRNTRVTGIPRATAPDVSTVQENISGASYSRETWEEPHPRGEVSTTSRYPLNHVYESERGHIVEYDDTPGAERINRQHRSGTYEEVVSDGTRTTKVVGDDFEITVKDKKVVIGGNCDITVLGTAKLYVQGDMYQEVDGNYFLTVKGDKIEKINGNHVTEIITDRSTQINGLDSIRIAGEHIETIHGNDTITIGGKRIETIIDDESKTNVANYKQLVGANVVFAGSGNMDLGAGGNISAGADGNFNISSIGDMLVKTTADQTFEAGKSYFEQDVDITGTSTATVDHISGTKSGKTHTHNETGSVTQGPN